MTGRGAIGLAFLLLGWAGSPSAWSAPAAGGPVTAVKVAAGPARAAQAGAVDTAATSGPLAIGAVVRDPTGVVVGHVTLITTDETGRSIAQVRKGVNVYSIPLADIAAHGAGGVSVIPASTLKPDADGRSH
jgi:hypothetical protein